MREAFPESMYDPWAPFPAIGAPGEFGRAWLDSLVANNPEEYERLSQANTLRESIEDRESEGQRMFLQGLLSQALVEEMIRTRPKDPDAFAGQQELRLRELVMDSLRVPPPPDLEEEAEGKEDEEEESE